MIYLSLALHIALGLGSILAAIVGFVASGRLGQLGSRLFAPSALAVVLSGAGLVVAGGSFSRACISGAITLSAVCLIQYAAIRKRRLNKA